MADAAETVAGREGARAGDVAPAPRLPDGRWRAAEVVFWLAVVAAYFAFPKYHVIGSQILITGLFAVSLDLILGYAGIVSLGHAACFGMGAYAAGLLAVRLGRAGLGPGAPGSPVR
jgi:branched-chain amino acid transport system permease protein